MRDLSPPRIIVHLSRGPAGGCSIAPKNQHGTTGYPRRITEWARPNTAAALAGQVKYQPQPAELSCWSRLFRRIGFR